MVRSLTLILFAGSFASASEAFLPEKLETMDRAIELGIAGKKLPGGVLWLERKGEIYKKAYGNRSVDPNVEAMTLDTVFDAASLTKVVATTPSIMQLVERRMLKLDDKVQKHIPELRGDSNKANVTVRDLMTHHSGLMAGIIRGPEWSGYSTGVELACAEASSGQAGLTYRYSDINFILLGELVHRVSGEPLDEYAKKHIFQPLGMVDSTFQPADPSDTRIAPTTKMKDGSVLRAVVHDPTSRSMGGVAGHAGLFTTAADLARYARMLLNGGELDGKRVLAKESVKLVSSVSTPDSSAARRALGFDIDSPYAGPRGKHFPLGSFGHTGWTGTSLWMDPFSETFVIFMSNRNHPSESGRVVPLRYALATHAAEAVSGFDFTRVPGALPEWSRTKKKAMAKQQLVLFGKGKAKNGIDVLAANKFAQLNGLKIGLITNHTGRSRDGKTTIDLLHRAKNVTVKALFSPEHGIRGTADEDVADGVDKRTGLKIYSLYASGKRKPAAEQLAGLDALVFDIQDIGCRFYTYISTMGLAMEAASEAGIKFIVLDRVNPIGGEVVAGPIRAGKESFTAYHTIPVRHGMTVGELAEMFKAERRLAVDLTVVPVEGWSRKTLFDKTGIPWVNPSPNMRSLVEAILYPGVGLLEFTNLSVGRGTRTPFEVVGAPFIDPDKFAAALVAEKLPGLKFVPIRFTPDASKYKDKKCGGVRILLKDRDAPTVDLGIVMAKALHRLYPQEWDTKEINKLLVHQATAAAILQDKSVAEIRKLWAADRAAFEGPSGEISALQVED